MTPRSMVTSPSEHNGGPNDHNTAAKRGEDDYKPQSASSNERSPAARENDTPCPPPTYLEARAAPRRPSPLYARAPSPAPPTARQIQSTTSSLPSDAPRPLDSITAPPPHFSPLLLSSPLHRGASPPRVFLRAPAQHHRGRTRTTPECARCAWDTARGMENAHGAGDAHGEHRERSRWCAARGGAVVYRVPNARRCG
ncbi:hypothetical protein DFH09DRAFT_1325008 [Mycena vulgaris]|nr:hypothetical protein DFH09DRAFT_1325008 [Mycena vulgaris]